jgi:hypothetical protein
MMRLQEPGGGYSASDDLDEVPERVEVVAVREG